MRTWQCALLLAMLSTVGCGTHHAGSLESPSLTPIRAAAVEESVQAFAQTVARDVTQEGPAAWRKHFADSPSFFMVANGRMEFSNSAAVTAAMQDLTRAIKQIELRWGDDLRVDPLTPHLAVVATTYHEVRVDPAGHRVEESGFFTGTAEYRDGRWQFRNAHWSVAAPPPAVP
jgi:Domain of unknown function (DUF4440)